MHMGQIFALGFRLVILNLKPKPTYPEPEIGEPGPKTGSPCQEKTTRNRKP